jgi:hypothetical protein
MSRHSRALPFLALLTPTVAIVSGVPLGCENDLVLPSVEPPARCGDGILSPGEECDTPSPGCIDCKIAPDWTCPDNTCSIDCSDPGVTALVGGCGRKEACNMQGYWAARETDYTRDPIVNALQTSTQWYLYHLVQDPSSSRFQVDQVLDCADHVSGGANVDYTPNTAKSLMYASGMDEGTHSPRMGTAEAVSSGCNMSLDRFFFVRGGTPEFLPSDFDNDASLPSNATLPWLDAPPIPAQPPGQSLTDDTNFPPGSVNLDGLDDGKAYAGGAYRISGTLNGVRHSVQRLYKGYASTTPIGFNSLSFSIYGNYSLQESVLATTDCTSFVCPLIATIATPSPDNAPWVTFSFIGSDLDSSRAKSVIVAPLKQSYATDLASCANVKLILPHDGSIHDGTSGAATDASADAGTDAPAP